MNTAILIATMSVVTVALRFLPFIVFRDKTPAYISYLGEVLPPALIGMLVVYCLKDVNIMAAPYGIPEAMALIAVVVAQIWKRNSILSILLGTILYMTVTQIAL